MPAPDGSVGGVVHVSAGAHFTCAVRSDGRALCWGANQFLQLGDGTGVNHAALTPGPVVGLTDAVEISAGLTGACARRAAGRVVCWGLGGAGVIGDGARENRASPTPTVGLPDAVALAVSTGSRFACARTASGDVACWGLSAPGGSAGLVPTAIRAFAGAEELAAGNGHLCVRRPNGEVACAGQNDYGQLGNGQMGPPQNSPVTVTGITDAVEVTAASDYACARRASGEVLCWGHNFYGQLGDGMAGAGVSRATPAPVLGLTDAVEIAAGDGHACARRASGAVVCWGHNRDGQLGDATVVSSPRPVVVAGLTDAVQLDAGLAHTCARRVGGQVVCWGNNSAGRLGDGTSMNRSSPTPVLGL